MSARLPRHTLQHYAGMLEQRSHEETNVRDAPVEARGLLHYGGFRVQGSVRILNRGFQKNPFFHVTPSIETHA